LEVGATETVAEGEEAERGVGVRKIILIAPSSGTGDITFLLVRSIPTIIMMMRKIPKMILVAATVFVRSSIQ